MLNCLLKSCGSEWSLLNQQIRRHGDRKLSSCAVFLKQHLASSETQKRQINVCVEGNIGSGKTTFLNHFKGLGSHVELIEEPVKEWRDFGGYNPLACLYDDPERWAFTFQSFVLLTLLKRHTTSQNKVVRIMERSILSARYCFAENLKQSCMMTDMEYNILSQWFNHVIKHININMDLIVYLQTSPEICLSRIQSRNRPEEQHVTLEYLQQLHTLHENWLLNRNDRSFVRPPVMVINGDHNMKTMQDKFLRLRTDLLSKLESIPG